jgi:hypothetical protein
VNFQGKQGLIVLDQIRSLALTLQTLQAMFAA